MTEIPADLRYSKDHLWARPAGSAGPVRVGLTEVPPGSARRAYLAVTDIEAAHRELTMRGVTISSIRHKSPLDDWKGSWQPGTDPDRRNYASIADFADPDGTTPGWSRRSATARLKAPRTVARWTDPRHCLTERR